MATGPSSDKLDALRQFLATLPTEMQKRLGAALAQAGDRDPSFPTDLVKQAMEGVSPPPTLIPEFPPLDAARKLTLRELVCLAIDPFITDEPIAQVVPGRVPRSAIEPWWEAMVRMGADEIQPLEQELAGCYASGGDVARFASQLRRKVSAWSDTFIDKLSKGRTLVAELRPLFNENLVREHAAEISAIMRGSEPLLVALHYIAPNGRVSDFSEEAAQRAKPVFEACSARMPGDSRYLVLALLNALEKPWQLMRLADALGWTRATGAGMRNPEMSALCERLIPMLASVANETKAGMAMTTLSSGEFDFGEVRQCVLRYEHIAEALTPEVDFRRDSAWGAQILKSREIMRSAFDAERLGVLQNIILAFMPTVLEAEAPPPEPAISHAIDAARLMATVANQGQRHGFGSEASVVIAKIAKELEKLTELLLTRPHGHEPQLDGAVKVLSILFPDMRTQAIARRVNAALGRRTTAA